MDRLGVLGEVVPEHISILEMGLGVTLLGVDEMRELGWVTDEEDGSVVEHPVEIALLSTDLDGETSGVAGGIGRAALATDGGETDGHLGLGSDILEELDCGDIREGVSRLEVTVGSGTLGVDDTLGNAFSVEVSEKIDVVEILEKERPVDASALSGIRLIDGYTV